MCVCGRARACAWFHVRVAPAYARAWGCMRGHMCAHVYVSAALCAWFCACCAYACACARVRASAVRSWVWLWSCADLCAQASAERQCCCHAWAAGFASPPLNASVLIPSCLPCHCASCLPCAAIAAAADARLDALTRSAISEVFQPFLVAKGQGVVYDMNKRSLETLQPAEPPESLWAAVLQAMELNQQQRQDALACYRRFGACLSRLVDQRLALNAQYKALQQAEEAADRVSKVLLRAHSLEVLQAISKSLAAYSSLDGVFAHTVTSIISGSQMAVACVSSYPWLPQWHTIMAALQQQDEAAAAAAADAAQARQGAKKPTRRGRPPRSTQLMGMQHTVRA